MKKDFLLTFIVEFLVLGSGLITYKFSATFLGKEAFSEYALVKRIVSFLQPVIILGFGVGIPRFIALSSNKRKIDENPENYFLSAALILIIISAVLLPVSLFFKDEISFLLFGNKAFSYMIFPVWLMLVGIILHTLVFSYFRGYLIFKVANFVQLINLGLIPLAVFLFAKNIQEVFYINGIFWIVISLFFLSAILLKLNTKNLNLNGIISSGKKILYYGIQRVPGDFGIAALFSFPPIIVAHTSGIKEAGYVAFGISMIRMFGAFFAPIGLILLPKASQLVSTGNKEILKYYTKKILLLTVIITLCIIAIVEIFTEELITLYLGKSFSDLVMIVRILAIGSLFYSIYVSLRSIIDAYYFKAINTRNILFSLFLIFLLSVAGMLFLKGYIYLTVCFVFAIFTLGGLTIFEMIKVLKHTEQRITGGS